MTWPPTYNPQYVPSAGAEHWDARLETMDPAERDEVILDKLRGQLRYAWDQSGFYREFWKDAPVDPADIRNLEEFARLREPANLLYEEIITEIVDEERGVGDEGPREAGAGHIYVVRSVLHVKAWSRECPVSRLRGRRAYAVPAPTPMLRDVRSPRPPARCVRLAIGGGAPARDDGGRS